MKKAIIITICVSIVAVTGLAAAGAGHWRGGRTAEHRIDYVRMKLTETLDLTEAQKTTLDRMAADILAEHDQFQTRRHELKQNFFEILNQDQVTAEELMLMFSEKRPQIEQLLQVAAQHISEFHGMLTPEQRTRLIEGLKKHRKGCRLES